jgi:hypothetical protein
MQTTIEELVWAAAGSKRKGKGEEGGGSHG